MESLLAPTAKLNMARSKFVLNVHGHMDFVPLQDYFALLSLKTNCNSTIFVYVLTKSVSCSKIY